MSSFTTSAPISPRPNVTTLHVRAGRFDPTTGELTWVSSDASVGGVERTHTATLTAPQLAILVNIIKATLATDYGTTIIGQPT